MLSGNYLTLYNRLKLNFPEERLIHDELGRLAYGTDASFYRLIPELVVVVDSEEEVAFLLKNCEKLKIPVTFRAAGTSLSGQAISDSVLAVLSNRWNKYKINEDASEISLQPGIIGARANLYLKQFGKKIGPDPASINAAKIGGIAANNASGMCCGTATNSYKTVSGMRIIFKDGTLLDTSDIKSSEEFLFAKNDLIEKINSIHSRIREDGKLSSKIRQKYKMKNTTGYSLNAFVDFDDPVEIIKHLMIGSEGTLGFIAEITYKTIHDLPHKATSLMLFPDINIACKAVDILRDFPVDAVELMDRASLRSVENKKDIPDFLSELDSKVSALLVETKASELSELDINIEKISSALLNINKLKPINFTKDFNEYTKLWDIRKGLFPSVGAMRKAGTTCIIEDITFPVNRLAEGTLELQKLLKKYYYNDAIIFGHALEGNLHFVFSQDFNFDSEINRYKGFINDLTEMVVNKFEGALKSEHGTGRNMAPFVELEWGKEAYDLMKEIKDTFDPENILNPGVIINLDKQAHLKNFKPLPQANEIIDKCIECGFCESHCPSKNITTTPRQRIVVFREISRLKKELGENNKLKELQNSFKYFGEQTCATDGLCSLACPVDIDTGKLIKELRFKNKSNLQKQIAGVLAANIKFTTSIIQFGLNFAHFFKSILGSAFLVNFGLLLKRMFDRKIPQWNNTMPRGAPGITNPRVDPSNPLKVIYFPSCINRTMGISNDYDEKIPLTEKTIGLLEKTGYEVILSKDFDDLCCGLAFSSKGFIEQGDSLASKLTNSLLKISNNGAIPIYIDTSPCALRLKKNENENLKIYEPVEFIYEYLLDKLDFQKIDEPIAIHTTCSSLKMELERKFRTIAELCSENVIVPQDIECCGWAGDRGFTFPELNKSALENLKTEINGCSSGYSTSRTCEIGLTNNSGISYKSIVYLVDKCTTKKNNFSI